ncbi:aldo-keto reductase family 1 member B1-like [Thrips palmi]|uniref:Aldo-keto reductase family 1 member B1-like n=1 Tax=Thrips palmi TaxID=161013 RepID=A0A6P8Z5M8_THRPL|nr:aldo-keto reductase family 1 member B1-like [Thrips palmi]
MPTAKLAPTALLNDGTRIPVLGLGTYKVHAEVGRTGSGLHEEIPFGVHVRGPSNGEDAQAGVGEVEQAVLDALDVGYRHIDTALLYDSEAEVGRAIRTKIAQGVVKREDVFVCTKLWNNAHRPDLVEPTCRQSLANLGLDYVDLYLMHWPTAFKEGPDYVPTDADGKVVFSDVDIMDTYRAMEELVRKGLVRSIGVSNFNSAQLERVLDQCAIKPVVNQVECHPHFNQSKLIGLCAQHGVRVVAYSPFGSPESPWSGGRVDRILDDPAIAAVARKHGKTPGQVVLRFLIQINAIPIPKSVTKSRIQQNFEIFDFELNGDDMETLNALNKDRRICLFKEGLGHPEYPFSIEY